MADEKRGDASDGDERRPPAGSDGDVNADRKNADSKDGGKSDDGSGEDSDDDEKDDKKGSDKKPKKGLLQRPVTLAIIAVVLVVLIVGGVLYWLHARHFQSTDDAYVDAHIVHLAPQIAGRVQAVYATDNELVGTHQPLVQIDPVDQDERLAQARAQEAQAQAQRDQGVAQRVQALAQIRTQQQTFRQVEAQVPGAEAQADVAARDYARYIALQRVNPHAVAQQQLDQARGQAAQTASQAQAQRRARDAAAAQVAQARTQLAASDAVIRGAEAQIAAAKSQVEAAGTNLGYSRIEAPLIGHVAKLNVQVGSYVQPGQELMAVVPLDIWVTANFKETQLKNMRRGQAVTLKVDAYPNVKFRGHVDSIQRGAGQAFAVLPSENATGNFVKVVQRVPVKILIDNLDDLHHPIGPGMSVTPQVRVLP